jgi:hypothetical protein
MIAKDRVGEAVGMRDRCCNGGFQQPPSPWFCEQLILLGLAEYVNKRKAAALLDGLQGIGFAMKRLLVNSSSSRRVFQGAKMKEVQNSMNSCFLQNVVYC